MKTLFIQLIKIYQRYISPYLGNNCRYYPTCSHYAVDALEYHGLIKGSYLAGKRILRCNPFFDGGIDYVPGCKHEEV
ncbi:MAG: membrane protein insertion efficiency factor YidD [Calditrichaeota bacterium]|nr:membrane protein insertion efficiency factor YidD [Calditrichota bacterium]